MDQPDQFGGVILGRLALQSPSAHFTDDFARVHHLLGGDRLSNRAKLVEANGFGLVDHAAVDLPDKPAQAQTGIYLAHGGECIIAK